MTPAPPANPSAYDSHNVLNHKQRETMATSKAQIMIVINRIVANIAAKRLDMTSYCLNLNSLISSLT